MLEEMQVELTEKWSVEPLESRKLYLLNKDYLILKNKLYRESTRKISYNNIKTALRFAYTGSFARLYNKIIGKKDAYDKAEYTLQPYNTYPKVKVVVYTCIWGRYDKIIEPLYVNPNIDYVIFTDQEIDGNSAWKKIDVPQPKEIEGMSPIEVNRFIKILPHLFLKEYDYSIYVDGNIRIIADMMPLIIDMGSNYIGIHNYTTDCIYKMRDAIIAGKKASAKDVKSQIEKYKHEGYPKGFGAFECNVIIRKHNDNRCIELMNKWWDEFIKTTSKRDQLSFMYVLWKSRLDTSIVFSLGNDVRQNPRFQIFKHN